MQRKALIEQLKKIELSNNESPNHTLGKLHAFIVQFHAQNKMPSGIPYRLQQKLNDFKEKLPDGDKNAWVLLLETMLIERLHVRNKTRVLSDLFKQLHEKHPKHLRSYCYHVDFLMQHKFYAECIQLIEKVQKNMTVSSKKPHFQYLKKQLAIVKNILAQQAKQEEQAFFEAQVKKIARDTRVPEQIVRAKVQAEQKRLDAKSVVVKRPARANQRFEKIQYVPGVKKVAHKPSTAKSQNRFALLGEHGVSETLPSVARHHASMFAGNKAQQPPTSTAKQENRRQHGRRA